LKVKPSLSGAKKIAKVAAMAGPDSKLTREERLAAQLRENLKRRKAQARAQSRDMPKPAAPLHNDESSG
jgi:hypothetical protein